MNNELQTKLGLKIRKLRLNLGLSQEKLAEKLDIAINTLSNIERGNAFMTSATIEKITKLFGVSYDELFNFDDRQDSPEHLYEKIVARLDLIKCNAQKMRLLDEITKLIV